MNFLNNLIIVTILVNSIHYSSEADDKKAMTEKVRKSFAEKAKSSAGDFEASDVEKVRTNDKFIERYIADTRDDAEALKKLIATMKWRKSFGVKNMKDSDFPAEIFKIGFSSVLNNKDKEGRPILFYMFKRWRRSPELVDLMTRYNVYNLEKASAQSNFGAINIAIDCNGLELSNIDVDLYIKFVVLFMEHYIRPNSIILSINFPKILQPAYDVVTKGVGKGLVKSLKLVSQEELRQYIDETHIPKQLGGGSTKNLFAVPSTAKPMDQLSSTKISAEDIKTIRKTFAAELK